MSSPGLCPETLAAVGWLPQLLAGGGRTSQAAFAFPQPLRQEGRGMNHGIAPSRSLRKVL